VEKSLSIQAHPNKKVAEKLHAEHPELYKDGNHKPEIAIPIGCFSSMCGFRCLDEILVFSEHYPELRVLVDLENVPMDETPDKIIKHLYGKLMLAKPEKVAEELEKLIHRIREMSMQNRTREEQLILRLNEEFPGGDVGVFSVFFLNLVNVCDGDYIFCAPDQPHAYLRGQCIECMASSDNVIRAGLTPKYKDVETLLSILTYRDDLLEEYLIHRGNPREEKTITPVGVDDFLVHKVRSGWCSVLEGPSILLCLPNVNLKVHVDEKEIDLAPGTVWFVKAGAKVDIAPSEEDPKKTGFLYIATC
jgi:mannose-6-phosphate isomerase